MKPQDLTVRQARCLADAHIERFEKMLASEALRKRQTRLTEELDETTAAITKLLKEQA